MVRRRTVIARTARTALLVSATIALLSGPAWAQTYVGQPGGVPQAGSSDVGAPSAEGGGASTQRAAVTSSGPAQSSYTGAGSSSGAGQGGASSAGAGQGGVAVARTGFPFARADLLALLGLSVLAVGAVLVRRARRQLPA